MSPCVPFCPKECAKVFISPLGILLSASEDDENPDTVVQPDISVFCHPEQIEEKGAKGAPTLVIEVLSPSTAFKDRNEKFYLYERFGVQEYWIVDPAHQTIEIYGLVNSKFAKRNVLTRHSF
ncbi:Uma2 family endonuclease [Parageobacillus thermoglucosidasius]|uniref:Uma2 family endonuclease n=1 Tax=Parageobacillus thermoglucosidasius TaxID=1426 RepID=UPI0030B8929D